MNQDKLKEVINNIVNSIDMSDLELYRSELDSRINIFELFFDNYFRKMEGCPCSHDKSIYVSKKIEKYLNTGENENLKQTYREYQQNGGNIGSITELDKICYWCPKTIKDSEEATSIIFHYLCIDSNYFKDKWKEIIGSDIDVGSKGGNKDE